MPLLLLFISIETYSQDSLSCRCSFSYRPNYPKKAEHSGICGEVLITISVDENENYLNPKVTKGLGYGCDEEAMRLSRIWIAAMNRCHEKCRTKKYGVRSITQKITFTCPPKDE
ncbi:MAG TPA: energy transducer TonB [Flavisolibacter sp.]|nr:energy transducer TonB [Flavisolibacter sp.]